ncbi:MAG: DUF4982 domain-containing protein [Spirochaetales bacterium]|nr:DUF4982 domain-containing protein [Spirochaetales bacterium]
MDIMKKIFLAILFCSGIGVSSANTLPVHQEINEEWAFERFGELADGSKITEPRNLMKKDLDDSSWRKLDVPHDWGIEGPFRYDISGDTGKLPFIGIGWYRKWIDIPVNDKNIKTYLLFEGVMSNAKIYVNGQLTGENAYGYSSFIVDISDKLDPSGKNLIAVRADNRPNSSRWYSGAGIYRNVILIQKNKQHFSNWGTWTTTQNIEESHAGLKLHIEIDNHARKNFDGKVEYSISKGEEIISSGKIENINIPVYTTEARITTNITISNPISWDVDRPELYTLKLKLLSTKDEVLDTETSKFGIRTIEYTKDGFFLNNKKTKFKGVCLHHDLGSLGAAFNREAAKRQLEIMKEMGCNAIRTSHNPPAPEVLELCDELGLLVMDEAFDTWRYNKVPNDYGRIFWKWYKTDIKNMVRRDRKHPSVVMWSSGNEISMRRMFGFSTGKSLRNEIRKFDTTRPVTFGANYTTETYLPRFEKVVDIIGYNYRNHLYNEILEKKPNTPIIGTETSSCISSRGEYFFPVSYEKDGGFFDNQVSSYDLYSPVWGCPPDKEFAAQDKYESVLGEFVWTGFDYLGEPIPYLPRRMKKPQFTSDEERQLANFNKNGFKPRSSYFGIVDLAGFKKDRFYIYQAKWRPELPMAHILPHWNWEGREGEITPVHVYTSGDSAELFLNGKSLGRKSKKQFEYRLVWKDVTYQPGELKVVAYKNGNFWAEEIVKTAGVTKKLLVETNKQKMLADNKDLVFIEVSALDKDGNFAPRANHRVYFTVSDNAQIISTDNGDASCFENFQKADRKMFNGKALAILKAKKGATGEIIVTITADGLEKSEIRININ